MVPPSRDGSPPSVPDGLDEPAADAALPRTPPDPELPPRGPEWLAAEAEARVRVRPIDEEISGRPGPDTSAYARPSPPGLDDALRVIPPKLKPLRPVDPDASGTPEPDVSAFARPSAPGMDDALRIIPANLQQLRPLDEDITGTPGPDTSAYARPSAPGMEEALRIIVGDLQPLRPIDEDISGTPEPDTRVFSRPNPPGMEDALRVIPPELARLRPMDPDISGTPEPDTSAFSRPSAKGEDEALEPIVPADPTRTGSNLEALLAIPVIEVTAAMREAWAREAPPPPPEPAGPPPLTRVTLTSSPGKGQVCPECKGKLRVVRTRREDRLDATWFRFEWLQIERGQADCPDHPQVETLPLQLPAFLVAPPIANGMLAWLATWRWRDHMPGHEIARLLRQTGIRCDEARVGRWLARAHGPVARVAAILRSQTTGDGDERGLEVIDGTVRGRMRARSQGKAVVFDWRPDDSPPSPDNPKERARDALLALRGWSREGRQASLRRKAALFCSTDADLGPQLAWRLDSLRSAADRAEEDAAFAAIDQLVDTALATNTARDGADPHQRAALRALARELRADRAGLYRFDAKGKAQPPLPMPEHVRLHLPAWFATTGDGGAAAMADWLTVVASCDAAGVPVWTWFRDLFRSAAEEGDALQPERHLPGTR